MVLLNVARAIVPLLFVLSNAARLPGNTVPLSYVLNVQPNYNQPNNTVVYDGQVNILIAVQNKSSTITLNYKHLRIYVVYLHEKNTKEDIVVREILYYPEKEQFQILLETELAVNTLYELSIEYQGTNKNDLGGLYNSTYANPNKRNEWMFLTNLETMGARNLFPCYDEPAYKTSYNISLTIPQFYKAVSNMPTYNSQYHTPGEVTFVETPPMSPHMVTLVASKFDWYSRSATDITSPVRVFTHTDYLDQVQYVAGEAPKMLKAMETFTGVRYDLPKLDLFAVPDFKSDAVGGWGLNTYREKFLLLNDVSSTKAKESGLSMVQREIARQWFGNLVTCSWWDYLWLHDAFATYFKYFTVHSVYPDWRMDLLFVIEQHQSALTYDQMPRRPITGSLQSADDINSAFYDQTYRKAAALLRMLRYATDDDTFQQSLARYLDQNRYKSVVPDVLFAAFQSVIDKRAFDFGRDFTVVDFMETWTKQAGYPVINVRKVNDKFVITQERFLIDTPDRIVDPNKWYIGITYTTESSRNFHNLTVVSWCKPDVYECLLSAPPDPGWFIFNIQSTGLYRVNYEADNWRSLIGQLKHSHADIDVLNRAQLIDDSFNLARADDLHYSVPLTLVSYLQLEDDVLPWYSAINGYTYLLERMRRNTTEYTTLTECVSDLSGVIYKKTEDLVVYNGSTDHSTLTGWNAISVWACGLDNIICTQSALEYFNKWQSGKIIPPDIRDTAYCIGIKKKNDPDLWQKMFSLYTIARSPSEKQSLQTALACTGNVQLLRRYLNSIFVSKGGPIRMQDFNDVFIAVSLTPTGLGELIDFLVVNLEKIIRSFNNGEEIAVSIYSICASKAAIDSEIIKLKDLKDNSSTPQELRLAFSESYHQVEQNLYWYKKYHMIVYENACRNPEYTTTDMPSTITTKINTHTTTETISTSPLTPESTTPIYPQTSTQSSPSSIQPKSTTFVSSTISPEYKTSTDTPKPTTPIYTPTTTQSRTTTVQPESTTFVSSTISPEYKTSTDTPKPTTPIYTRTTTQSRTTSEMPISTTTNYSTTSTEHKTTTDTPEPTTPINTRTSTQSSTISIQPESTTLISSTITPEYRTSTDTPKPTTPIYTPTTTQSRTTTVQPESTTFVSSTISPEYKTSTDTPEPTTPIYTPTTTQSRTTTVQPESTTFVSSTISPEYKTSTDTPKPTTPIYTPTITQSRTTTEMPISTTTNYSTTSPEHKTTTDTPEPTTPIYTPTITQSRTTKVQPESTTFVSSTISPEYKTSTDTPEPTTPIYTPTTTQSRTTTVQPESTTFVSSTISPEYKTSTDTPEPTTPIYTPTTTQSKTTTVQPESTTFVSSTISPEYKTSTDTPKPTTPIYTPTITQSRTTTEMPISTTTNYSTTSPEHKTTTDTPEPTTPINTRSSTQSSTISIQPESTTLISSTITPEYRTSTYTPKPTTPIYTPTITQSRTTTEMPISTTTNYSTTSPEHKTTTDKPETTTPIYTQTSTQSSLSPIQPITTTFVSSTVSPEYKTSTNKPVTTTPIYTRTSTQSSTISIQPLSTTLITSTITPEYSKYTELTGPTTSPYTHSWINITSVMPEVSTSYSQSSIPFSTTPAAFIPILNIEKLLYELCWVFVIIVVFLIFICLIWCRSISNYLYVGTSNRTVK